MRLVYTIGIHAYTLIIRIAAVFNAKAALWVNGRKNIFETLKKTAQPNEKWLWFHAASLGEFEQGRPLIEAIKKEYPNYKILLTFFSPSGYEIRKNYELADCVSYLPADTPANAKKLLDSFLFEAVFFIKYEFWFNYMHQIGLKKIPFYFVSAKFRANQHFFAAYGSWFREQLKSVTHFFVQDETSVQLLNNIGFTNVSLSGDTRFDRVFRLQQQAGSFPIVEHFKGSNQLIIAGSTWPVDENMLQPIIAALPENFKIVIAPHDVSEKHILSIEKLLKEASIRYTDYDFKTDYKILIINNIGILSQLYRYAAFAYVGGGFGGAIHNIQEAITYGCPVIIGPNHQKFSEAVDLIKLGGVMAVNNETELQASFAKLIQDEKARAKASSICTNYVRQQIGATEKIMEQLRQILN